MSNLTQETDNQRTNGKRTSRKIRIGIVGCGEVTQIMHWPSLNQLADLYEVTALCDISPLVLETLGKRLECRGPYHRSWGTGRPKRRGCGISC